MAVMVYDTVNPLHSQHYHNDCSRLVGVGIVRLRLRLRPRGGQVEASLQSLSEPHCSPNGLDCGLRFALRSNVLKCDSPFPPAESGQSHHSYIQGDSARQRRSPRQERGVATRWCTLMWIWAHLLRVSPYTVTLQTTCLFCDFGTCVRVYEPHACSQSSGARAPKSALQNPLPRLSTW